MDISTARVEPHQIAKSEDFEYGFQSLIRNTAVLDRVLTAADIDYIAGGEAIAVPGTMTFKVAALWANGKSVDLPAYLGTESTPVEVRAPQNFPRRDIVQVRGILESFDNRRRAFLDPELEAVKYLNIDTKNRLIAEIVVIHGTESASHAPYTDAGYIKIAEIHVDPETFTLTQDNIKNVTALNQGEENDGWTGEKARTFRPGAGGLADLSGRINEEVRARKEADQNIVERIDNLPIATETTPGFVRSSENDGEASVNPYTGAITADARIPITGDLMPIFPDEEWDMLRRPGVPVLGPVTQLSWPLQIAGGAGDITVEGVERNGGRAFRVTAIRNWTGIDLLHTGGNGGDGRIPFRVGDRITVRIESVGANQFILNADNTGWDQLAFAETGAGGGSVALVHTVTVNSLGRIMANNPQGMRIRGNAAGAVFFVTEILVERGARRRFSEIMRRTARALLDAQLATNTWLPSVNTVALLPAASGLDANKNYLCKVLADPNDTNNIAWQLVAGAATWTRFGDMTFIPTATATERGGVRINGNGLAMIGDLLQIPANGVTDAMLGTRIIRSPDINHGLVQGNLTDLLDMIGLFIQAMFTGSPVRLAVASGGTGATNAEEARTGLGVPPVNHAANNTDFGVASDTEWGHVRLIEGESIPENTPGCAIPITRLHNPATLNLNDFRFNTTGYFQITGTAGISSNLPPGTWVNGTTHGSTFLICLLSTATGGNGNRQIIYRTGSQVLTDLENIAGGTVWTRFRGNGSNWSAWTRVPQSIVESISATGGDFIAASVRAVREALRGAVFLATPAANGVMSSADKAKLDGIEDGATATVALDISGGSSNGDESEVEFITVDTGDGDPAMIPVDKGTAVRPTNIEYVGVRPDELEPVYVGKRVGAFDAGHLLSLGIRADGSLWAWGSNTTGQTGLGVTAGNTPVPTRVGADSDWAQVSAGQLHTMAIRADGSLWAWGSNMNGQTGLGVTAGNTPVPTRVGADSDWAFVSAGSSHTLGIRADGSLWAWGINMQGNFGDGTITQRTSPIPLLVRSYAIDPASSRLNWNWQQQGSYDLVWLHNGLKILSVTGNNGTSYLTIDGFPVTGNGLFVGIDGQWRPW